MNLTSGHIAIALVVGAVVLTLALGLVGQLLDRRRARKAEYERKHHPWDPAICPHEWELQNSGDCQREPVGWAANARPRWKTEVCTHCGTERFTCDYSDCVHHAECAASYEAGFPEPCELERKLIDRIADAHGFEYLHYQLRDRFGNEREAWCRIVPTTIAFSCPDCGGMVVGVDVPRAWAGTSAPEPTAFRCEQCGRREDHEFGVPRVMGREGNPVFTEPRGAQPACPRGGKHNWELLEEWSTIDFPEGVDSCLENLSFLEEVWHQRLRCTKCGEERTT